MTNELLQKLLLVNDNGVARSTTPLVPTDYDTVELSNYNASNDPGTVTYKKAGVAVCTLTLTYDGSNRLSAVTRL